MILTIKRAAPAAASPGVPVPALQPQPSAVPTVLPSPLIGIQESLRKGQIQVSPAVVLEAGEEMTLQAEIVYADGTRSREFSLESAQKEIVAVKADQRTIQALKQGLAQLKVFDPRHTHIQTQVQVEVQPASKAVIELEIEYKE